MSLNPFEVREVLQANSSAHVEQFIRVSIPLKSGRCCKLKPGGATFPSCLNPFEVREVLQESSSPKMIVDSCLNPFEVREVLQAEGEDLGEFLEGLNPFEVREVLQG